MSRFYQDLDYPHYDYKLGKCEGLQWRELRGPVPDLGMPYIVCVGAAQTFGRFCDNPFASRLSKGLKLPVLNLGLAGAGPRAFLSPELLGVINRAEFAVVQVLSGRSESNSGFDNGETGATHGVRLRDRKKMRFEEFIEEELANSPHETVQQLVEETRDNWVARYRELLHAIAVPKVLFWFSSIAPDRTDDYSIWWKLLGPFPQLVNRRMLNQIKPFCDVYVESVCALGLPQPLWPSDTQIDGTELRDGRLFNTYYPSPEMHEVAARELLPACKKLMATLGSNSERRSSGNDVIVIASNRTDGSLVAELCGSDVKRLTYRQVTEDEGLMPFLASHKAQIIHVRRRNLLEGHLVDRIGQQGQVPAVDPADFISDVQAAMRTEGQIARSCPKDAVLEVFFEDVSADPSGTAGRIATFLKKKPRQGKANAGVALPPPHLMSQIPNLDDLRATLVRAAEQFTKDSG